MTLADRLAARANAGPPSWATQARQQLRRQLMAPWAHGLEYAAEAWGLSLFMMSACFFGALLEYPASPVHQALPVPWGRRALMGLAMGSTAILNIYAPWGRRSGAHFNPAVTLAFWRLGKVATVDVAGYLAAQVLGAAAGVALMAQLLPTALADPAVRYVATVPGAWGSGIAWLAEALIAGGLLWAVLTVSNSARWTRWTGIVAGSLVALYITVEAPVSGMSMNPARSLASALFAGTWTPLWIYLTAPLAGMSGAAAAYAGWQGAPPVFCAKLSPHGAARCIFRCRYGELSSTTRKAPAAVSTNGQMRHPTPELS